MIISVEGIVLNVTPYGETSKIINVYTKEYGLIGIIAKGAMTIKSPLRSATNKLSYANFNIYYKKDKLSLLKSVDVIDSFKNIQSDILLISYATYLCELVSGVIKQNNSNKIYDDLINSLLKIERGLDPLIITNILEVKLLDYLGVGLNLTNCILCGSNKNIVTLSSEKGGLICRDCYTNERIMPLEVIKILNMYYLVDIKSINKLNIKKEIVEEINNFLSAYYEDYTGLYLKSKDFLKTIQKL